MVNIDKIRALAKQRGMKLGYIQEQLGVRRTYFAEVKAGKDKMSDERIVKLAKILGTSYEYLTDETDFPYDLRHFSLVFLWDRYEKLRLQRHLTQNYVERSIGIPYGVMDDVREKIVKLSEEQVKKLAILLDTTYNYLMGLTDDPGVPVNDREGVKIRVFGDVAAGIPIQQIDNFDPEDADSWEEIDRRTAKNGTYFALRIKGDSMEPRMFAGDVVIVRYQQEIESGDIAIVAINGDEATCKKITLTSDGMILNSLNPKYEPRFLSSEAVQKLPVRILGKVVEVRGKL